MSKRIKEKKEKIPKLTEAEYAEYIASLKISDGVSQPSMEEEAPSVQPQKNGEK